MKKIGLSVVMVLMIASLIKADSFVPLGVCQTSDGGYALTGVCGSVQGNYPANLYVMKVDSGGDLIWRKIFPQDVPTSGQTIKETPDGGLIVFALRGASVWCWWLLKFDNQGYLIWDNTYEEHDRSVSPAGCDICPDEGYMIASESWEMGSPKAFSMVKIDKKGNLKWKKTHELEGQIKIGGVKALADGYIVATLQTLQGIPTYLSYLRRLDEEGEVLWQKQYSNFMVTSVNLTKDKGFIIIGRTTGIDQQSKLRKIAKLDENGVIEWEYEG